MPLQREQDGTMYEKELKAYCRRATAKLHCSRAQRAAFKAQVYAGAQDFLAEQPDAPFAQVQAVLGAPEEAAAAYMESLPPGTAERWRKRQRTLLITLVAAALALAIAVGVLWYTKGIFIINTKTTIIDSGEISESFEFPTSPPIT